MTWQLRIADPAKDDIQQVLAYTLETFGEAQHDQYLQLIEQALREIAEDPTRPNARRRPELHKDAIVLHIGKSGRTSEIRGRARHMFVYRIAKDGVVDVARLLYDGMDIVRHLPDDYLPEEGSER